MRPSYFAGCVINANVKEGQSKTECKRNEMCVREKIEVVERCDVCGG